LPCSPAEYRGRRGDSPGWPNRLQKTFLQQWPKSIRPCKTSYMLKRTHGSADDVLGILPAAQKMNQTVAIMNRVSAKGGLCLYCTECNALLSEYKLTTERYAVLSGTLERAGFREAFKDLEFQELKDQVAEARLNCHRTRNALSTHQESQVCRRSRPSHHGSTARTDWESAAALGLRLQNPIT
jgi:hypothetical protein